MIHGEWELPGGLEYQLMCWLWPMTYLWYGIQIGIPSFGGKVDDFVTYLQNKYNQRYLKKHPPELPKDKYLLEAEREVDEFLGYKDVPEEVTVQSFNSIGPDVDIRTAPAIRIQHLIDPWDFKVHQIPKKKHLKAYNTYLKERAYKQYYGNY